MNRIKLIAAFMIITGISAAAQEGNLIYPVILKDAQDREVWLPENQGRNLIIFYNDYRNLTDNKKTYDTLIRRKLVTGSRHLICVVNMKPAWFLPDSFIRYMLQDDVKNSKFTTFLFDDKRKLQTKWRLRDCDYKSVVLMTDKRGRIKFIKYGRMNSIDKTRLVETMKKNQ